MKKLYSIFLYAFLALLLFSFRSSAQTQGKPFLRNYEPKEYQGHVQNWAITQDQRGIMYFGNGNGMMTYDGNAWRIMELPRQVTVRSMAISETGLIYVGSSNDFGYWGYDEQGNGKYNSLTHLIPDSVRTDLTDIWETHAIGNVGYFRTYYYVFRYQDGKVTYWPRKDKNRFFSSFVLANEYYFAESGRGVYNVNKIVGDTLEVVADNDKFRERQISISYPYKKDTIILSGRNGGLYKYPFSADVEADNDFFAEANQTLKETPIYTNAVKIPGGYALGSLGKGVVVFDRDFKFVRRVGSKNNGLRNTTIYTIFKDRDDAVWVGGSNGVGRIDLAGDISYWDKSSGLIGNIYWIKRHEGTGTLYVSTSEATYLFEGNNIKKVQGINERQCWHMLNFTNPDNPTDKRFLVSTSVLFELNGDQATPVLNYEGVSAGFKMYKDIENPYRVWLAYSDGFGSMIMENGKWVLEERIEAANDNNRSIAQDKNGDIWLGTFRNGVIRLIKKGTQPVDDSAKAANAIRKREQLYEVKRYKTAEGVLSNKNVILFEVAGKILFGTDKGICIYNPNTDRFEPFTAFGEEYANGKRDVFSMQEASNGDVWLCGLFTNTSPGVVMEKKSNGTYELNTNPFKKVPPMMTLGMTIEEDGTAWLGGSEGLFRFKRGEGTDEATSSYPTIIRKIIVGKDSLLFGGNFTQQKQGMQVAALSSSSPTQPVLDYAYNTVSFHFSAPFYDNESETHYKYYLEGFDAENEWGAWEKRTEKEYNNLKGGTYTFYVKARNLYGNESEITSYTFVIKKPWYLRWYAYLLYILGGLALVSIAVKWNARRLEKENERLEGIVEKRTAEVREQNVMLQQQKEEITTQAEKVQKANDRITIKNAELSQQKEEILAQAENLRELNVQITSVNADLKAKKNELEKAYDDIQNLSEIGQAITSTLDLREIIRIVYENVNELMDASGFGIGVYDEKENILEFKGYIEKGETLPDHYEVITKEDTSIAIKVFNSGQQYLSNDLEEDFKRQGKKLDVLQGEVPLSLIYLPLVYNEERVGVITVQSFERNAYTEKEVNILITLASYASIALAHAQGYEVIKSKNKDITDSIRYSKTMQTAFLPSKRLLSEAFPNNFLIYYPRDIVSGDFYWVAHLPEVNKRFLAVVDCTGHGVPGSFMSIVGSTLLNEIINIQHIHDPAQILEELNHRVVETLSQDEHSNDDGMDVCLGMFENEVDGSVRLTFSGAKRDLYYIRNGSTELEVLHGDRKLIGGRQRKAKGFTNQTLYVRAGDTLYFSTDGLVDQHNDQRKKFGTLRLKSYLSQLASLPIEKQGETLEAAFIEFKGVMEQRDDVTLLGISI
ncbi:MAG: SpoIIE family protein phosphatase [Flammeovirgaceae bacterium]